MVSRSFTGLRTASLDPETRSFMEHGFAEDFRNVSISVRRETGGPLACTVGAHVVFAAGWYLPQTWLGRVVLAHELAHVVQKRRGARRPSLARTPAGALEAEAHAAGVVVAGGARFQCSRADRSEEARCWEEEGHYYTCYLIMLAAGISEAIAHQTAVYAQIPDEIEELDAAGWGKKVYGVGNKRGLPEPLAGYLRARDQLQIKLLLTMQRPGNQRLTPEELRRLEWLNQEVNRRMKEHMLDIQMGLHCLSGRPSAAETRARAHRLLAAEVGSVESGLAVHAYGDSFSHRNRSGESRIYSSGLGHAVDIFKLRDPHAADHIDTRPELYFKYGLGLYHIMCQKTPGHQRLLDRETLGNKLLGLTRITDHPAQVLRMRQIAAEIKAPMRAFAPEENTELYTWGEYQWHFGIPPNFLEKAMKVAKAWRQLHANELLGGDEESVDAALPAAYLREKAEWREAARKSREIGRRKPGEY